MRFIRVGNEPTDLRRRSMIVARSRLADGQLVAAPVVARLASAVEHGGEHALADFREDRADVQFALHFWCEALNLFLAARILQIIESSTVCKGSGKRGKLQRRYLNSFAVTGHPRDSAVRRRRSGKRARVLLRQVVSSQFAEPQ